MMITKRATIINKSNTIIELVKSFYVKSQSYY